MTRDEIIEGLTTDRPAALYGEADRVRRLHVGNAVHLRGLVEISNACGRDCCYCGLRRSNHDISRYRMNIDEIFSAAKEAASFGFKSLVLQSGENCQYPVQEICRLLKRIKLDLGLAITLSMGEKSRDEYAAFKEAGADRYLIRFETSSEILFRELKPDSSFYARMQCLTWLRELGFQVGSGIMVGLPGQTPDIIADDILLMEKLDLDMIGIGPFISNPKTPLKDAASGSLDLTLRALALLRIITKNTHIPATTAMGSIEKGGRERALRCGANVLMPNVTPTQYRSQYALYPNKICIHDQPSDTFMAITQMLQGLNRTIATDPGHSLKRPHV
ncbi:MAG: [FeFe] hydrogenase H-cluster radical SAM maturase HydE [Candidatus Omnitrophota bacterium]